MTAARVMAAAMPMLAAAEAAAALGAWLRIRVDGTAVDPALATRLDAVLDALDVRPSAEALDEHDTVALASLVEGFLALATDLVTTPDRAGWDHEQTSILMAQGHTSALLADAFERLVVPRLGDDLAERRAHGRRRARPRMSADVLSPGGGARAGARTRARRAAPGRLGDRGPLRAPRRSPRRGAGGPAHGAPGRHAPDAAGDGGGAGACRLRRRRGALEPEWRVPLLFVAGRRAPA
jgi:hypothetical protein